MAQRMMFDQLDNVYRGQAENGTVVSVNEDAMNLALSKAGKSVYDADWWVETLESVLKHWGIHDRRWLDEATRVPRMHFELGPKEETPAGQSILKRTGPLLSRLITGKLRNTEDLSTGGLGADRLKTQDLTKDEEK